MKMLLEENNKLASAINSMSKYKALPHVNVNTYTILWKKKPLICCFACGYQKDHTSRKYNVHWKAKNHKSHATIDDSKGGCQVEKYRHDDIKQKS